MLEVANHADRHSFITRSLRCSYQLSGLGLVACTLISEACVHLIVHLSKLDERAAHGSLCPLDLTHRDVVELGKASLAAQMADGGDEHLFCLCAPCHRLQLGEGQVHKRRQLSVDHARLVCCKGLVQREHGQQLGRAVEEEAIAVYETLTK